MKPAWDKAAAHAEEKYNNVVVADVDCTVEKTLCQKQGVKGYPTIKYWVGGSESKLKKIILEIKEFWSQQ